MYVLLKTHRQKTPYEAVRSIVLHIQMATLAIDILQLAILSFSHTSLLVPRGVDKSSY